MATKNPQAKTKTKSKLKNKTDAKKLIIILSILIAAFGGGYFIYKSFAVVNCSADWNGYCHVSKELRYEKRINYIAGVSLSGEGNNADKDGYRTVTEDVFKNRNIDVFLLKKQTPPYTHKPAWRSDDFNVYGTYYPCVEVQGPKDGDSRYIDINIFVRPENTTTPRYGEARRTGPVHGGAARVICGGAVTLYGGNYRIAVQNLARTPNGSFYIRKAWMAGQ